MKIQHTAFTEHLASKQGLSPAELKWVDGLVLVKKNVPLISACICVCVLQEDPEIAIVSSNRKAQVHLPECWTELWRTHLYTEAHPSQGRGNAFVLKVGQEEYPQQ